MSKLGPGGQLGSSEEPPKTPGPYLPPTCCGTVCVCFLTCDTQRLHQVDGLWGVCWP